MRRWVAIVVFVAAGSAAWAAGYDDYMRGYTARQAGNIDLALSSFTAALDAPDLAPNYRIDAYVGRADMLMRRHRCAEALADAEAALALRPKHLEALTFGAHANACLGKFDAALANLDVAIAIAPTTGLYSLRADFHWYRGDFALSAADYLAAVKQQSSRAYDPRGGTYSLIWYAIAASRAKTYDAAEFAKLAHGLDDDEWPGPLMAFIAGKAKLDEVYREAARGDVAVRRKCEADFFIGEWQVANGNADGKALLQGVAQSCPSTPGLAAGARNDLKRLP